MKNLKKYLPPIMRTTYWSALLDSVEETIDEIQASRIDSLKEPFSISEANREELLEIASSIYSLDTLMVDNLIDFLIEQEMGLHSDITEEEAESRALERVRQEIAKIPYSMDKRGTLNFYSSIFHFCGFNYPGAIALIKTDIEEQVMQVIPNFSFDLYDSDKTQFIEPEGNNNFSGVEDIVFQTLDYNQASEGEEDDYTELDEEPSVTGYVPTLDIVTKYTELVYRKAVFLGLLLNEDSFLNFARTIFSGNNKSLSFPENMGRYYRAFLNLNKRATDILIFGPMIAINVSGDPSSPSSDDDLVGDHRLVVNRLFTGRLHGDSGDSLEITSYRVSYYSSESDMEPLYTDENPIASIENSLGAQEGTVLMSMLPGETVKKYSKVSPVSGTGEGGVPQSFSFSVPEEEWESDFVLRVYNSRDNFNVANNTQFLFYKNEYDSMILRYSSLPNFSPSCIVSRPVDGEVLLTISADPSSDNPSFDTIDRAAYIFPRLHTRVARVQVDGIDVSGTTVPLIELLLVDGAYIELCKDVTLSIYLSIHDVV